MPHRKQPTDVYHSIGYGKNEQHLGQSTVSGNREMAGPQAGLDGEEGSRICGQAGPELLGGKIFIN
jgi:hypothetical protein